MTVSRKTEISPIDGTPVKRMFWSLISDYDLKTSLSELVDNAIDMWVLSKRRRPLHVAISLDHSQQFISVHDDAGGVRRDELRLLITPGGSRNDPDDSVIGIFGVGGKRASVALGEHVEIRSRHGTDHSYEIDITKEWQETDEWEIPAYEIPDIAPRTTSVEISRLRDSLEEDDGERISQHLGETYSRFIGDGCSLEVNGARVTAQSFDAWAYPKGHPPQEVDFDIDLGGDKVKVVITAGLIVDRDPERDNYGVYVYCNDRLIVKELRTRDVGYFVTAEAGVPHSDASLCRAIVRITGPAKLMPWNSSKSGINPGHTVFQHLRRTLIQVVSHFSSLSRRLRHDWDSLVFPYRDGSIERISATEIRPGRRLSLPVLPRVKRSHVEHLKERNKKILKDSPWTLGLVEGLAAVDVIQRQRLQTRNRIALILLDSNFEIALKEFIVHRPDLFPPTVYTDGKIQQLFRKRQDVVDEVTKKFPIPSRLLTTAGHYYLSRNKLIHERATVDVTEEDVDNYRSTIQEVLKILFGLKGVR